MRIGINALYLLPGQVGGTEVYLRHLLDAMGQVESPHEFRVFTNRETGKNLGPENPNWRVIPQGVQAHSRARRILFEQTALPSVCRRHAIDVLLNPGFTGPYRAGCPSVTVFHDLQHVQHPEHFRWWDLPFWRLFLSISAYRSTRLIAVSDATRTDLARHYRLAPESISVVRHGVADDFFEIGVMRAPEPYLFCVSTYHPHKNLDRLVKVFAKFHQRHPGWNLVLTGLRGFHTKQVEETIRTEKLERFVRTTGWVSREELLSLYAHAGAFVYPSEFEGFGMPVLEAMACGLPVACSSIPPLNEISAGVAVSFPPRDEAAMLEALEKIAFDQQERTRMRAEGPRRARQFSWDAAARATLRVLEEAASWNRKS